MNAIVDSEIESNNEAALQYLTFDLSGEVYGIGILNIREIIEYGDLTQVPMMPEFISGVINLRGSVVPVVNLAIRFQVSPQRRSKKTSVVIIEVVEDGSPIEIGIIVDEVREVMDLKAEQIAEPPTFGAAIRADFIKGMGKIDGQFMILLDVNNVLSVDELSVIQLERKAINPDTVKALDPDKDDQKMSELLAQQGPDSSDSLDAPQA
ncbi:MAG: chemotaxis protein CheW [Pseudomonadales bacterium]|nr:chemotaxis protein CheW [Pseudomonadales bacterium]